MKAEKIMNNDARWETCDRTAWNCDDAICPVTNHADLRESWALHEDTLDARAIMGEATKGSRRIKSQK